MGTSEIMDAGATELYELARASAEAVREALSAVPSGQLEWRPASRASTVLEILRHLCQWEMAFLSVASQGSVSMPFSVTAETHPEIDHVRSELDRVRGQTLDFLQGATTNDLDRRRTFMGREMTVRELIVRLLRHEHYHVGQIHYLHFLMDVKPEERPLPHPPEEATDG